MPHIPLYIWPCGSGVTCYTESYHNVIPAFVQAVAAQGAIITAGSAGSLVRPYKGLLPAGPSSTRISTTRTHYLSYC